MLITNIVLKAVTDFCMGLKFLFEVRNGDSPLSKLPNLRYFFKFKGENFIILVNFKFFSDVNSIAISETKLRFQF